MYPIYQVKPNRLEKLQLWVVMWALSGRDACLIRPYRARNLSEHSLLTRFAANQSWANSWYSQHCTKTLTPTRSTVKMSGQKYTISPFVEGCFNMMFGHHCPLHLLSMVLKSYDAKHELDLNSSNKSLMGTKQPLYLGSDRVLQDNTTRAPGIAEPTVEAVNIHCRVILFGIHSCVAALIFVRYIRLFFLTVIRLNDNLIVFSWWCSSLFLPP